MGARFGEMLGGKRGVWRDMSSAPKDRPIIVYRPHAPATSPRMVGADQWSEELGGVWKKSRPDEQPACWADPIELVRPLSCLPG